MEVIQVGYNTTTLWDPPTVTSKVLHLNVPNNPTLDHPGPESFTVVQRRQT